MLAIVENIRGRQIAWVQAVLEHKKWRASRLASEAGINHSTLSKFLNDPLNVAQLNTLTIEKIAAVGGIPPYETRKLPPAPGFSETEAEMYDGGDADFLVRDAVNAIKGSKNHIIPWVLRSRALEFGGYIPGDILFVDLNAAPQSGDIVCAQVYDRYGRAETVFRLFEHPFLAALSADENLRRPILLDDRAQVRGVVAATLRPRKAA